MNYKKLIILPLTLLSLSTLSFATVYSDAEDGTVGDWKVYDNKPSGAVISNIIDDEKNSKVIEFKGEGRLNAYLLGSKNWKNGTERNLSWSMKFSEKFKITVYLFTKKGLRTLFYDHNNADKGLYSKRYIKLGLGSKSMSGTWQNISRNLDADLRKYEPDNSILFVKGLKVQGSGRMDDIRLEKGGVVPPPNKKTELNEDAEDGTTQGWRVVDNSPAGATITNVSDADKNSKVIQLKGAGRANDYLFGTKTSLSKSDAHTLSWSMKIEEKYKITVYTSTQKGRRSFVFTASNRSKGLYSKRNIHMGLNADSMDGTWQNFSFDLDEAMEKYEPNNKLFKINGFKVQGSGLFDDILVSEEGIVPPVDHGCITREKLKSKITNNEDVTKVNTSCIKEMSSLFYGMKEFNQDIGQWDVSNVTNMDNMFYYAKKFNQDISQWDVSNVTSMKSMFNNTDNFNQPLDGWDVSNVTNMYKMFKASESFNQPLNSWNVSNVTDMGEMFGQIFGHTIFNQPIDNWDVSHVKNMRGMFYNSDFNQNIDEWDVSNVTDMGNMFTLAKNFKNHDLSGWNVKNVEDRHGSFGTHHSVIQPNWIDLKIDGCITSKELSHKIMLNEDVTKVNTSCIKSMFKLFANNQNFNQDISQWDVSNVTNMYNMFYNATSFNQDLSGWDVSNVTDMKGMFEKAKSFTNQDLSGWNVDKVEFYGYFVEGTGGNNIEPNWK